MAEKTDAPLAPELLEARKTLARFVTDKLVDVVTSLPENMRTDAVMAELHITVIWQLSHALVAANIANIDAVRNACGIGIQDGIRTNAQLRELAKQSKGEA